MFFPLSKALRRLQKSSIGVTGAAVLAVASFAAPTYAATPSQDPSQGMSQETTADTTLSGNFLAGHVAQKRRDLPAAVKYLGAALAQDEARPELLRSGFLFSLMNGHIEDAFSLARRLADNTEGGPIALLALAVDEIKQGNWDAADRIMASLDRNGLSAFTVPAIRAWTAYQDTGLEAGLEALAPLRENNGTQTLYNLHAGLMQELSGDLAAAEQYYLSVSENNEGASLRSTRLLATLYERQGKIDEARAAYNLFLDAQANSRLLDLDLERLEAGGPAPVLVTTPSEAIAEALFGIASSLNRQGGYETSLVLGRLALYLRPDFPIAQFMLGDVLEGMERYEDAIAAYRLLAEDSAFWRNASISVAHALNRLERKDEAVDLLRDMSAKRPRDPGPEMALGDIFRRHEQWLPAVDAYDEAFRRIGDIDERHWQLLYTRGIVLERSDQWERAEADFLKALEFEPDQPLILNYLGYSWVEQGVNLDRALEMIKTAVAKRPHDGYITDSLGWVYYRLGRYEEAVPELERAVELRPEDPVINDHLGDAYWKVGRRLEASFQWNHALNLDPEPDLKEILEEKLSNGLVEEAGDVVKTTIDGG